jgi:mercuric ion binding protein
MKHLLLTSAIFLSLTTNAMAGNVQYNLRVDGVTCPFCVATSAKALKKIEGVNEVSADLEKGIIKVCADEKTILTDEQLTKLFIKKGFTYRGMKKLSTCEAS